MEIERKYLVKKIPRGLAKFIKIDIEQSYISTNPVIRLRKSNNEFFLTVKGSGHIAREEFELQITREQYEKLQLKAESNTLMKTRYLIPIHDNLTAELDVYCGKLERLFTVEVEFQTLVEAEKFQPPNWFGEDISNKKEYKNSYLAMNIVN